MPTEIHRQVRERLHASPGGRVAVRLAAAADAFRTAAPAVAVIDAEGPLAVGTPDEIGRLDAPVIELPGHVALPPLVNAHAHLDLTSVGPLPFDGSFAAWASEVRARRPATADAVAAAVREGVRRAVEGGTGLIGDIAGRFGLDALGALRDEAPRYGLRGVAYVEAFGIGSATANGVAFFRSLRGKAADEAGGIRLGASPHAPYSCGDETYAAAAASGLPVATHLAETLEEERFVHGCSGPLADLLREVGAWTPELRGWNVDPVRRILPLLRGTGAAVVHLNYVTDGALAALAAEAKGDRPPVVVYCPRASAYFRHPDAGRGPHRYREMLAAGIPVALGTDSAIVLGNAPTISVLDEMRFLHRRDGVDPTLLLAMATSHGARALGESTVPVTLPSGSVRTARALIAVDAAEGRGSAVSDLLGEVLRSDAPCRWLWPPGSAWGQTAEA